MGLLCKEFRSRQSILTTRNVCVLSCFSHVPLLVTPWVVACQSPLSMGFSWQNYWNGFPCPSPGDLPDPGIKPVPPVSPELQVDFFFFFSFLFFFFSLLSHQRNPTVREDLNKFKKFNNSFQIHQRSDVTNSVPCKIILQKGRTWNKGLIQTWERSVTRLYVTTLFI